jgi:hypothetical protein
MDIKAILTAAGLSPEDAAPIFQVTKPTVYNWIKGATPKSVFIYNRALEICSLMNEAVSRGWLPVTPGMSKEDRAEEIRIILIKTKRELTLTP